MNSWKDEASSGLYLVRIWKRQSEDGGPGVHGKLQHVVSGASCYFDTLSALPEALETMMEINSSASHAGSPGPHVGGQTPTGQPEQSRAELQAVGDATINAKEVIGWSRNVV